MEIDDTRFSKVLLGDDQLNVARIRGTQALHSTHDKAVDRLEGFIPVTEDLHARMNLMKVIKKYIYNYCTVNTII